MKYLIIIMIHFPPSSYCCWAYCRKKNIMKIWNAFAKDIEYQISLQVLKSWNYNMTTILTRHFSSSNFCRTSLYSYRIPFISLKFPFDFSAPSHKERILWKHKMKKIVIIQSHASIAYSDTYNVHFCGRW